MIHHLCQLDCKGLYSYSLPRELAPPDSTRIKNDMTTAAQPRSFRLAIGSTGRRITMENQAKKRKGGAEKLSDKNTLPSLDKVLPIKKWLCLFYIKLKKLLALK